MLVLDTPSLPTTWYDWDWEARGEPACDAPRTRLGHVHVHVHVHVMPGQASGEGVLPVRKQKEAPQPAETTAEISRD